MTATIKNNNSSVVYSFEGRWEEALRKGQVRVFFRKRRPTKLPRRIFFYVGVPVKAIIGFAEVEGITSINLREAVEIRTLGAITENELIRYVGQLGEVNAIRISAPTLFAIPAELSVLKQQFSFNPPQSFSIMEEAFEMALLEKVK
jgi:predicted transcriptional regulator